MSKCEPSAYVVVETQSSEHTPTELCFTVTISSPWLRPYPRSEGQLAMLRRALVLREVGKLTYAEIAENLTKEGFKGTRDAKPTAEGVYGLIKKLQRKSIKLTL